MRLRSQHRAPLIVSGCAAGTARIAQLRMRSRSLVLEGADLDRVGSGGRMGGGELDRLFLVGAADHVDPGDVLAGGEERAVGLEHSDGRRCSTPS